MPLAGGHGRALAGVRIVSVGPPRLVERPVCRQDTVVAGLPAFDAHDVERSIRGTPAGGAVREYQATVAGLGRGVAAVRQARQQVQVRLVGLIDVRQLDPRRIPRHPRVQAMFARDGRDDAAEAGLAPGAGAALLQGGARVGGLGADGERGRGAGLLDLVDGVTAHQHPPALQAVPPAPDGSLS